MVGNISDMQAEMPTRQYRPTMPGMKNGSEREREAADGAEASSRPPGLKYFSRKVQMNRLTQKMDHGHNVVALSASRLLGQPADEQLVAVVDDEGPAHDLRADVEGLGDHALRCNAGS
jgi:hypothetical protein